MDSSDGSATDPRAAESRASYDFLISYSRIDRDFAERLHNALTEIKTEVFRDLRNLTEFSPDWLREITSAIHSSHIFVVLLSPDYLESQYCQDELRVAIGDGKRLAVIEHRAFPKELHTRLPDELRVVSWDSPGDPEVIADRLKKFLNTDFDLVRDHTRILAQALLWIERGKPATLELRGNELRWALSWRGRTATTENLRVANEQIEFLTQSEKSASRRSERWFRVAVLFTIVLVGWLIQRSDFWQAGRAYKAGSQIAENAGDSSSVEWTDALMQLGRPDKGLELASTGYTSRAAELASRRLSAGNSGQAIQLLGRVTQIRTQSGLSVCELEGRLLLSEIPTNLKEATSYVPLGELLNDKSTTKPHSADEYASRAESLSQEGPSVERIGHYVRAAFLYSAENNKVVAEKMLKSAIDVAQTQDVSILRLLVLDRLSQSAKSLEFPNLEDEIAVSVFWSLRQPRPVFAHIIWLQAAKFASSKSEVESLLQTLIPKVHELPSVSKSLALLSIVAALNELGDAAGANKEMDPLLAARSEISNDYLRGYVTAGAAKVLSDLGRTGEATQIVRDEGSRLDATRPQMTLTRSLCVYQLASGMYSAGNLAVVDKILTYAVATSSQLNGKNRLISFALGGWITATISDSALWCLDKVRDSNERLEEPLRSQLYGLAAEALVVRKQKPSLRATSASFLRDTLKKVEAPNVQRELVIRVFPSLLEQSDEGMFTFVSNVWDCLSRGAFASEVAARDPKRAAELVEYCDFDKVPSAQRSLARSLVAQSMARAHRIRDARSMAEPCDPEDRLLVYAAIVREYSMSGVGRFLSKIWSNRIIQIFMN